MNASEEKNMCRSAKFFHSRFTYKPSFLWPFISLHIRNNLTSYYDMAPLSDRTGHVVLDKEGSSDTWQRQLSLEGWPSLNQPSEYCSPSHESVKRQIHLRVTEVITGGSCTTLVKDIAREICSNWRTYHLHLSLSLHGCENRYFTEFLIHVLCRFIPCLTLTH
jgi:hypothetical protein